MLCWLKDKSLWNTFSVMNGEIYANAYHVLHIARKTALQYGRVVQKIHREQTPVVWFKSDNLWPCTKLFVLFLNSIRCALSWFATIYSRGRSSKEWYTIQTLLYILISFVAVTRCGILLHRMLGSPRLLLYLTRALIQSWVAVDAWQVVELQ